MLIQPKIRGFICATAHPDGCYKNVSDQIDFVKSQGRFDGPKNVLVIGASTGYGLASRIVAAFGAGSKTIGVFFERKADDKRTASAGWYNTAAFEKRAHLENIYAKSINGDAFTHAVKQQVVDLIRRDLKEIDLIIYSLAAPRRIHPDTGEQFASALKPIGLPYTNKTLDPFRGEVKDIALEPATESDIAHTVAVMGGEDWEMWIDFLAKEKVLARGAITVAYSYLGPVLTHPIYKDGTIGRAKEHLQKTAERLRAKLKSHDGQAWVSINKALVTQASSAIPVVPLYIALLFKIMKEKGTHEGCIEQMNRLYRDYLYASNPKPLDEEERIRLDDFEMQSDVQQKIADLWSKVTSENIADLADVNGYCEEFSRLFGFGFNSINYEADANPFVEIDSL